ncbi:hypothetical protein LJR030_005381 [Rhizobium sp. LjRoot30]|uniref:hypothetical protein n=1 Tax=Rhizobium sp. LjRoot30 TaxID=3342320 RepID=UPI003ECF1801
MTVSTMETGRRRFLLGLAAAATAAAAPSTVAARVEENPRLIALAAALPAIADTYHAAEAAYMERWRYWRKATPLAPDAVAKRGTGCPRTTVQPGRTEMYVQGGYLYRQGEEFPSRIFTTAIEIRCEIQSVRRKKQRAKKAGAIADFLAAEEELAQLEANAAEALSYEKTFKEVEAAAEEEMERLNRPKQAALYALYDQVAAIMAEDDRTMEGLIVKAEALAEWDRVGRPDNLIAAVEGDWHGSIAASILRHAKGGAT